MLGSLIAAILIVIGAVWAVTARLGPTSIAELEAKEDAAEAQEEQEEDAREAKEEAVEGDDSGRRRRRGRN
jgi:hypothetical protein